MTKKFLEEIEKGSKSALTKKRIIMRNIYQGSASIPELAQELNLSVPTTTKIVLEMCDDGYLDDFGKQETAGGRPPHIYGLNPDSAYFVGVDIRQDELNIATINFKGDMVDVQTRIPYTLANNADSFDALCQAVAQYTASLNVPRERILNVGFNVSGRVNPTQGYAFSNFNYDERPLAERLTERLALHVTIDNDTRAMTYGEYLQGCVRGERDILFVNLSWGLGLGIIIDGHIYSGKSGFAGELGHVCCCNNEQICHCGKKGCLETEVSGSALFRKLSERIRAGASSCLSARVKQGGKPLTLDEMLDAVAREDVLAIETVEQVGQQLGKALAGLINVFNPELVILGGQLSAAGDYLLQPVRTAVKRYSLNLVNRDSQIQLSRLKNDAGVVGACLLARSRMFEA